jgi:hypothetical protein
MATEQDEVVKITLEVVDKFSKPLDNLMRELDKIDKQDAGGKTKKSFDGMRDSVNGVAGAFKTLTPALSGSLAIFTSIAAAIGAMSKALHDFAGNTESLQRLSTATGFGLERMRELEAVARRFGGTAAEVRAGMRGLADSFHDIKRGGPIFQELAAAGLPRFANQLRNAKTDAERLEIVLRQLDRLKDPFEKRRLLGMLHGPEVFADATGEQRKRLEEEYRKTNPPLDQSALDKVKRYEDSLWKSGNALDAIIEKNVGDLDTLSTQLDTMAKATLAARDGVQQFNDLMEIIRKNGEWFGDQIRGNARKPPGKQPSLWDQLFGLPADKQSYTDPGGKTKDVIKSATAEGVVDGFLKFAMLMGNRGGDGGARTIPASYTPGSGGNRTRSHVTTPPQDNTPPAERPPIVAPHGPRTAARPPPGDPGVPSPPPPSSAGPMGADPNQRDRPYRIGGKVTMDGKTYTWGSGGAGRGSLPYGDFPINIGKGDIGSVGKRIGSIATIGGPWGTIDDPKYPGRPRGGIQIHAGSGSTLDRLYSQGCFAVSRAQWPAFKAALLEKAQHGQLMLHIGRDGMASITTRGERGKPDMAKPPLPPEDPRKKMREQGGHNFAKVEGDATVRIDVNGLPRGSRMAASSSGIFSSVELHRGSTLPLASETG